MTDTRPKLLRNIAGFLWIIQILLLIGRWSFISYLPRTPRLIFLWFAAALFVAAIVIELYVFFKKKNNPMR